MENNKKANFTVIEGGPLVVTGDFSIKGIDGKIIETNDKVYLCRCGDTKNRPFCDGSHKTNGFCK